MEQRDQRITTESIVEAVIAQRDAALLRRLSPGITYNCFRVIPFDSHAGATAEPLSPMRGLSDSFTLFERALYAMHSIACSDSELWMKVSRLLSI